MSAAKHTPTPWKAREYPNKDGGYWIDCDAWRNPKTASCRGGTLATAHKDGAGEGSAKANADFIVHACNAHDDLVAALQAFLQLQRTDDRSIVFSPQAVAQARAALAKAGAP